MSNVTPFYLSPDFGKRQILNACFQVLASPPSSPNQGQYYFDSVDLVVKVWNGSSWDTIGSGGGGGTSAGGGIETVSVATSHGFAGTSDNDPTNPTITLSTTITGVLKGNGTSISAATSGTDFAPATSGTSILKGNGSGGFSNASAGTDYAAATSGTSALKGNGSGGFGTATINDLGSQTGDYSANSNKITNLSTPSASGDAATKGYVDGLAQGVDWKASVRAISTANATLSSAYENGDTLDGLTLATGDRILLSAQTTTTENGIYTVNASGAPTRATDADASGEISKGSAVYIEAGTAHAGQLWVCTATASTPWVPGTDSSTWTQFAGAADIVAGAGLTKTGNTIDLVAGSSPSSGGPGGGLVINADNAVIDTSVVPRKVVFSSVGDNSSTTFALTHSLSTKAVSYSVRDKNTDDFIQVAANANSTSQITLDFGTYIPTSSQFEVIVQG